MLDPNDPGWIADELNDAVRKFKNMLDARDARSTDEPAKEMVPMKVQQSTFNTFIRKQPRFDQPTKKRRMGACCTGALCDQKTEGDCTDGGGIYFGDYTQCGDVVCIACPTLTLACDSITASLSKCGFSEFGTPSSPPKKYLTKTSTFELHSTASCGVHAPTVTCTPADDASSVLVETYDPDTCAVTSVLTGSETLTNCDGTTTSHGARTPTACDTVTSHTTAYYDFSVSFPAGPVCTGFSQAVHTDCVLSDENTADVCEGAVSLLPSYSGTFGCGGSHTTGQGCLCSAFRNLSTDGTSCTIRRFKYKFLFTAPMAGVEFDITWCERFIPEGGDEGDATYTDQTWHYGDTGDDNSDVFTVNEPDADGTTDICCIRCCITAWPDIATEDLPACDEATCP